jgi:hypothetical protein
MALKQFVIPLDASSIQTGDITFEQLCDNEADVEFQLTNAQASASIPQLNLVTKKNGSLSNHLYAANVSGGSVTVTLTPLQMKAIFGDADGGDWDYVEANWSVGAVDTPQKSNQYEVQSGRTYDMNGFPPKEK